MYDAREIENDARVTLFLWRHDEHDERKRIKRYNLCPQQVNVRR